jgi:hypothetical protein
MPASPGQPGAVPGMPMEWTTRLVSSLSPVRFGRGVRLELHLLDAGLVLNVSDTLRSRYERFDGSPSGWAAAWTRAAEWSTPERFGKAVQGWSSRARWAGTPLRSAEVTARLDAQMPPILYGLTFLGGHGYGDQLTAGTALDLRQASAAIALTDVTDGRMRLSIPAGQLTGAEASGPGKASGPFAATVGHGLLGDVIELGVAQDMNSRFAASRTRTQIRIRASSCELFLITGSYLPEAAQLALSAVRAMAPASATTATAAPAGLLAGLEGTPGPGITAYPAGDDGDLVSKLERLARLRESGAITQFEFQAAKQKLLH